MAKKTDDKEKRIWAFIPACEAKDWDKAIEIGTPLLADLSDDDENKDDVRNLLATAYDGRGNAYQKLEQYDKAMADYNQAIALDPNYADPYNGRGITYRNLERYDEAIADFNQAITIDPEFADPYNSRGNASRNLEQYDKAMADYDQAIALDPKFAEAYHNRGLVYAKQEQYDEAIADYTQAITLKSEFADPYHNRGNIYQKLEQYDKAIADYTKAITLDSEFAEAYNNRGNAYAIQKQYDKAIADYTQAITLKSDYVLAYNNRALAVGKQEAEKATETIKATYEERLKESTTQLTKAREQLEEANKAYGERLEESKSVIDTVEIAKLLKEPIRDSETRLKALREDGKKSSRRLRWVLPMIWGLVFILFSVKIDFLPEFLSLLTLTTENIFARIASFSFSVLFISSPFIFYVRRINHDIRVERQALEDLRRKHIMLLLRNVEPESSKESTKQVIDHFDLRGTPETLAELYHPKHTQKRDDSSKLDQILEWIKSPRS